MSNGGAASQRKKSRFTMKCMEVLSKADRRKEDWVETEIGHCANQYVKHNFFSYLQIFTDDSKDRNDHVRTGVYIQQFQIHLGNRITHKLCVYSAEMMAVIVGRQWVEEVRPDRVLLYNDPAADLLSLQTMKSMREELKREIYQYLFRPHRLGSF